MKRSRFASSSVETSAWAPLASDDWGRFLTTDKVDRLPEWHLAYGVNVDLATLAQRLSGVGPGFARYLARLDGYRLAFSVNSQKWKNLDGSWGLAATLVPARSFSVWGVLYRFGQEHLDEMDRHEKSSGLEADHPRLYGRMKVTVRRERSLISDEPFAKDEVEAWTYVVRPQDMEEQIFGEDPGVLAAWSELQFLGQWPSVEYIDTIRRGGTEHGFPAPYLYSLATAQARKKSEHDRWLIVQSTTALPDRSSSSVPILQVSPRTRRRLGLGTHAVISAFEEVEAGNLDKERSCVVRVVENRQLAPEVCGIDRTIRKSLAFPSLEPSKIFYGGRVRVMRLSRKSEAVLGGRLSNALRRGLEGRRNLMLSATRSATVDAEQGTVCLHPKTMRFLGVEPGDNVDVYAVRETGGEGEQAEIGHDRRPAFEGHAAEMDEGIFRGRPYPMAGFLHIDADGRSRLGIPEGAQDSYRENVSEPYEGTGYPVLVAANWRSIFGKEFGLTAVSFLLAADAFFVILTAIFEALPWGRDRPLTAVLWAVGLATVIGLVAAVSVASWSVNSRLRQRGRSR
jgi:gamma-glutamylcyclotransferase (GGCT)/AIG2-like uncharacterized protein YtfP